MAGQGQEDPALSADERSVVRHIPVDEATEGRAICKWTKLLPSGTGLVLLIHLAQVIHRQGLEQRNQDPEILEGAGARQKLRPQPGDGAWR